MSFEFVRKPQPGEYADTINMREVSEGVLLLPNASLVAGEHRFWRDLAARTDTSSKLGSIAVSLAEHMDIVREGYMNVIALRHRALLGRYATAVTDWYTDAAVALPYSRLLRRPEVFGHLEQNESADDKDHLLLMDYMANEPNKTGLHIPAHDTAAYGLPCIDNGLERWLADDDLFLRTRRPAEPTLELLRAYRQNFGRRLDRSATVSFSPRMKIRAWIGQ